MSIARAVQVSIVHLGLGILIGSAIEGIMPQLQAGASIPTQIFEVLVQGGLNGAAISMVAGQLQAGDPTFGIPFSMALYQAQPDFADRIQLLASVARSQVTQAAQKTAPPVAAV